MIHTSTTPDGNRPLEGKTAVVTGGSTGIGFATAKEFIEQGARVIITGQDPDRLKAALEQLRSSAAPSGDKEKIHAVRADVRSIEQLTSLAEETKRIFDGHLDILFVNSGVVGKVQELEEVDEESFDWVMGVNLKGAFFTVQKLSPLLVKGSSIIFNLSAIHSKPAPPFVVYAASKGAGRSLVRSLSVHFAPRGIRVNSISPGVVPSEIGRPDPEKFGGMLGPLVNDLTPLKRRGTPEEIAKATVFLASDDSSYVTGADLAVDGGLSA